MYNRFLVLYWDYSGKGFEAESRWEGAKRCNQQVNVGRDFNDPLMIVPAACFAIDPLRSNYVYMYQLL